MEGLLSLAVMAAIYFIPYALAHSRKHASRTGIGLLNLLLGWTVLGWIAALIWAASGRPGKEDPAGPTPDTHIKCPDCAELIRREAKVCKHCGCKLIPQ